MLAETDLRGVIAAAITPVTQGGEVDVERLLRHCAALLADGCRFVSTFGTTGEGASLSTAQKSAALAAMAAAGASMARQIPAIMSSSVDEAARLLAAVAGHGCRAALVLPPFYYNSASEAGIVDYFDAMLARAGRPDIDLLLYNIPALSRIRFTPALVEALLGRFGSRIVGIKDSTGDRAGGIALARGFPQLSIFTGDDRVLPDLLRAGGAGLIGGMPNLFARDLAALCADVDGPAAAGLVARSAARILAVDGNGALLALKAMLARRYKDGRFAEALPPLRRLSPDREAAVAEALRATGYEPG